MIYNISIYLLSGWCIICFFVFIYDLINYVVCINKNIRKTITTSNTEYDNIPWVGIHIN